MFAYVRSRAEEQVAALRQTVGPDCLMQTDWINYVLGAAYPELEQFLGWVQASYLDNLQDSGLRRLARVANLRTDAFLASLRDHEKPKMEFNQLAHLPTGEVLPEKDVGNKANGGVVDTVVVAQHVPMNDAADSHSSAPKLDPLLQQGKIKDAVGACAQVQGCTTTTAACNFLLKRCSKEMLGEAAASAVFAYLEQTAGAVPDVTTYSHFIENLCQAKNVARAMATLTQMRARGVTPRDEDFAAVVSLCIGLADFSKGIQVVRQAIEAGSMPALELLNALISTTKTTEETTTAFQAISTAGHEPNKRSYQQLVEASCVCGDSSLAVRALRQMAKRGMVPTEELVTRAVERCATVNVRHCLKILEMCAADSLPLPAKEGVLYFLQMCCKNGSSQLSASAVQDCLTAMHSVGFTIDPDLKDAFRTLRVSCRPTDPTSRSCSSSDRYAQPAARSVTCRIQLQNCRPRHFLLNLMTAAIRTLGLRSMSTFYGVKADVRRLLAARDCEVKLYSGKIRMPLLFSVHKHTAHQVSPCYHFNSY